ncbi:uncharacterized protein [Drosophila pseudoobscura]|uniref:Secreted protein n=1 Tax=Drosophila pseudoobscura pseudoobscura TaxID=46245 RepID=A0A6I8W5E7_DROPS|nr:uncharacterized protein LOC117184534 [Drosophila pseudoobscura]
MSAFGPWQFLACLLISLDLNVVLATRLMPAILIKWAPIEDCSAAAAGRETARTHSDSRLQSLVAAHKWVNFSPVKLLKCFATTENYVLSARISCHQGKRKAGTCLNSVNTRIRTLTRTFNCNCNTKAPSSNYPSLKMHSRNHEDTYVTFFF